MKEYDQTRRVSLKFTWQHTIYIYVYIYIYIYVNSDVRRNPALSNSACIIFKATQSLKVYVMNVLALGMPESAVATL